MSFLSNLVKQVSPVVARVAPFIPGGQIIGAAAAAKSTYDIQERQRALTVEANRRANMFDFGNPTTSTIARNLAATRPVLNQSSGGGSGGFAGFLNTLSTDYLKPGLNFLSDFGGVFGGGSRPQSAQQGPALTTITNVGAQESQSSGSIQAGMGSLLPNVLGGARSLLKSPLGQIALGGGAGLALSGMPATGNIRVTRKMKSQFRMVLNLTGGNIQAAADILGVEDAFLIRVLLKRFRNDGAVVTKAALRKTKSTVRKLKNMCDMYDSLRPTATRRRTPMKRASSTTLIKN